MYFTLGSLESWDLLSHPLEFMHLYQAIKPKFQTLKTPQKNSEIVKNSCFWPLSQLKKVYLYTFSFI